MPKDRIKYIIGIISINVTSFIYSIRNNSFGYIVLLIYKKLLKVLNLSLFPIENTISYQTKYNNLSYETITSKRDGVEGNMILPFENVKPTLLHFELPEIRILKYKDVYITPNSDVVVDLKNDCVINDYCYNICDDVEFIDGLLYRQKSNVCILRNNFSKKPIIIQSGIMISGKFSGNYFHEMYENLNRLILVDKANIHSSVPIIVDEIVLKIQSFKKILELLTIDSKREIIVLKMNNIYLCQELFCIDHINLMAPHIKIFDPKKHYCIYDIAIIKEMKKRLLICKLNKATPKKIFLSRKKSKVRHFNEEDVVEMLQKYGFETVYPEDYLFEDQVTLFNNAEWIIGGSGAAFTNLIFCRENCKIICFFSNNIGPGLSVFDTIAHINNCKMWSYESNKTKSSNSIHSDYYIDVKELEKTVLKLFDE